MQIFIAGFAVVFPFFLNKRPYRKKQKNTSSHLELPHEQPPPPAIFVCKKFMLWFFCMLCCGSTAFLGDGAGEKAGQREPERAGGLFVGKCFNVLVLYYSGELVSRLVSPTKKKKNTRERERESESESESHAGRLCSKVVAPGWGAGGVS